ncbi:hypothetical protein CTI12_AA486570 [Artemisia annua]|uniref:K-box domain-containing protein n=1 Tax=Artemisia annua TaxID=35608 RepID=A0A2U1LIZ5_ARTAN|nr:hypothetical protein CTI12_AA486570 [Artemisia annua]
MAYIPCDVTKNRRNAEQEHGTLFGLMLNGHLMGEKLGCLNVKELKELETRLERGISKIRSKKNDMILAETENLQKREVELEHHNEFLRSKVQVSSRMQEIRTSTSSMTSVPKPLKFLHPHYGTLKSFYESMTESDLKKLLAYILSVLALTMSADGEPESLKYRMLGSKGDIGSWGHEYVR